MRHHKQNWLKDKYLAIDYNGARIKHVYFSTGKTAKQIRHLITKDLVNYLVNSLNLKKEEFENITKYINLYNKEAKIYGEAYEKEYLIDYVFDLNEKLNLLEKNLITVNAKKISKIIQNINK